MPQVVYAEQKNRELKEKKRKKKKYKLLIGGSHAKLERFDKYTKNVLCTVLTIKKKRKLGLVAQKKHIYWWVLFFFLLFVPFKKKCLGL